MVGLTEKYPSLLEDFQTGTALMARKRHLHQAQGVFYVFVLWNAEPIRSIRLIRGRKEMQFHS